MAPAPDNNVISEGSTVTPCEQAMRGEAMKLYALHHEEVDNSPWSLTFMNVRPAMEAIASRRPSFPLIALA